jgi:hypothetical protein
VVGGSRHYSDDRSDARSSLLGVISDLNAPVREVRFTPNARTSSARPVRSETCQAPTSIGGCRLFRLLAEKSPKALEAETLREAIRGSDLLGIRSRTQLTHDIVSDADRLTAEPQLDVPLCRGAQFESFARPTYSSVAGLLASGDGSLRGLVLVNVLEFQLGLLPGSL